MSKLTVHPAADIFPLMSEEELADLAEDIKVNGLVHPLIVDKDNQLIDGRNRFAACKLAGVEPRFEQLNGRDPLAYIASANLQRRNLTKGQKAMAYARIYPDPAKGGRGKKNSTETLQFSPMRLSQARSVLAYSPVMAESVLRGEVSLDDALQKVEEEKTRAQGVEARLERLRKGAPDLAELVAEERMPLNEAYAAYCERGERRLKTYEAGVSSLSRLNDFGAHVVAILSAAQVRLESESPLVVKPEYIKNTEEALILLKQFCERTKK